MDHDPSWDRLLTTAIAERRFQRLRDLFDADSRGEALSSRSLHGPRRHCGKLWSDFSPADRPVPTAS
jgi:hypothetical protein